MLDLRRVRVLAEVAKHRSFSRAAVALGYTQPAVSRQVATLEAELGVALVRRAPQGAVLTDAGRLLTERAEPIFGSLDLLESELHALQGLEGGRLRVSTFPTVAATLLPRAVARFRARYPAVGLELDIDDLSDAISRLRAGEIDLAIENGLSVGDHPDPGRWEEVDLAAAGLSVVHLLDDPMYVALPAGHPLAARRRLRLADLRREPWMLATTESCPDARIFLRACHDAAFEPHIAFQNDDYPAILGFVAAGVGVALVPDMVARTAREDVVIRSLGPSAPARPILAVAAAGYCSPAASAMIDLLTRVSAEWEAERPTRPRAARAPASPSPPRARSSGHRRGSG